jgi:hypothetical protein
MLALLPLNFRLRRAFGRGAFAALAGIIFAAGPASAQTLETNSPSVKTAQENEARALGQFLQTCVAQWHHGPGLLSLDEVNPVIANPQARGNEAAAAVMLQRVLNARQRAGTNGISAEETLALAAEPEFRRRFFQLRNHIWYVNRTIKRSLFLDKDPNFLSFHQGRMEDCYFLAVVGDVVCRDPRRLRSLIAERDGGYSVSFPGARTVSVPFLTDAELVMGASVGADHGVWLSVLEKAFGLLRAEHWEARQRELAAASVGGIGASANPHSATIADIMGHGGSPVLVIALFTGHGVNTVRMDRWFEEQEGPAATNAIHELLAELTSAKRLITVSGAGRRASVPLPAGIIRNHVFGVVGYRPVERLVVLFNPWGNFFNPKGQPGIENGYLTRHGVFDVPLQDFVRIFSNLDYETEESLDRRF